ncbi:hypothetical protein AAHA92_07482 [Salvia divinorum]|uniref:Uncharacterized protein n=1 Tax=Salvia divinorum TaxID=28513 RepID=A0ABD1I9U9_SALDI
MAKRRRQQVPGGEDAGTAELNSVFIDTNLGTHLAVPVYSSDTVSDLKKKVAVAHKRSFPEIGEIQVHSVKLEQRSNYYHLSDDMLVWTAFGEVNRDWFLSVTASIVPTHLSAINSMFDNDDDCKGFISDRNKKAIVPFTLPACAAQSNAVSEMIVKPEIDKTVEKTTDSHKSIYAEEHCMGTESPVKKKRKVRHTKDECQNSGFKGGDTMFFPNSKASDHVIPDLSPKEEILLQNAEKSNFIDQNSHKLLDSDERKEDNALESIIDYEGKDVPSVHSGVVHTNISDPYATLMDVGVGTGEVKSNGKKRKKKKVHNTAEVQHRSDVAHTEIGEMNKPLTETTRLEEKGASLELDNEVIMPADIKASDHVDPDLALKEASIVQDADAVMESEISSCIEKMKKKRAKNSASTNIENSGIKDIHSDTRGSLDLSSPSGDHITKGIGKDESTILNEGMDLEMRPLDAKVQHTSDVARTEIGEMKKPHTETTRLEEKGASLELDNEVIMPADSKAPDHVGPDVALKEASIVGDADAVMEAEISSRVKKMKKKKRAKNSVSINIENSGVKDIHNGTRGSLDLSSPSGDHITKGIGKDESTILNEGMDLEMRLLDAKVQHTSDVARTEIGEMKKPHTETTRLEEKGASLELDNEGIMPADSKAPDHVGPDVALKEASIVGDADAVMEAEISSRVKKMKKKKRAKNSVSTNIENSGVKDIHNGTRGSLDLSSPSGDHITMGIGKDESTILNEGMDVKMRTLDAEVQHTSDVAHTEMKKPRTETTRLEEKGASLELDSEVIMPSDNKAPDHVVPDLALKEVSIVRYADAVMEAEISSCVKKMKKKKRAKNSVSTNIENSDIKDIHNGTRGSLGLSPPSGDYITKGIGKDESTILNEGMDVETRPLDTSNHDALLASNHDAQKKVRNVNRKEANLAETQAERTLEDVSVRNEMMTEKTKSFQDVCHAALPTTEKENTMIMWDADAVMEPEVSSCIKKTKKKKRTKNSVSTNIENSGIKDTHNGTRGSLDLSSPSRDHISTGIGKDESTRLNEGMDVEMTLLDASNNDAQEKVWDVNRKEEERTSEDLSDRNKMMMEKTKRFPDVCHAALPTAETENTITKPNQANQDNGNTENKSRKATKKGKKQKHTAIDVQENLPVEDQQVGVEPLATRETSFGFANSELAGRDVESSQVLSRKSEEKVDENYELVLNTDGFKENTEKGSEGINFKQYFVADQVQNQVDISNKVRKATKLKSSKAKDNEMMKTSSPSELCEMPRQKPNDFVAPSSSLKKNPSLDKSSSKRSVTLHNNKGNERMVLRSHFKNTMPMKTPKKKILLAKSGAIFHNDSGESSGDENGTLLSDDRTLTPSDSSSMSGDDSEGESEVSQILTSNESSAVKGKTLAMLEEENVTMDVILRSSKRFKKAKEIASQIEESQPIDFVPDSQPV